MANRWRIPRELEDAVRARDTACIYCSVPFGGVGSPVRTRASWEHIVNDASIITFENIALCCRGCNASKGRRPLREWLSSTYCKERGIGLETLAFVAQDHLRTT